MKKILIGIDSSLSCTGIAVVQVIGNKKLKLLETIKVAPDFKMKYEERVAEICAGIDKVIEKYRGYDLIIGIEEPNSVRNVDVTRKLCGLYGAILHYIWIRFKIELRKINTSQAKKNATGDGTADKAKIIKFINTRFNTKFVFSKDKSKSDDDLADAISMCCFIFDKKE